MYRPSVIETEYLQDGCQMISQNHSGRESGGSRVQNFLPGVWELITSDKISKHKFYPPSKAFVHAKPERAIGLLRKHDHTCWQSRADMAYYTLCFTNKDMALNRSVVVVLDHENFLITLYICLMMNGIAHLCKGEDKFPQCVGDANCTCADLQGPAFQSIAQTARIVSDTHLLKHCRHLWPSRFQL